MSSKGRGRRPLVAEARYRRQAGASGRAGGDTARAGKNRGAGRRGKTGARDRRGTGRPRGPVAILLWPVRMVGRLIWAFGWRLAMVTALVLAAIVAVGAMALPPADEVVDGRTRGSVTLLDRYGDVFAWRGDQFGGVITAETVSPHLKNAIVATEDRRFWRHPGVDPIGVLGAVRINLAEGRGPLSGHGGSTITQQTAKLLCLGRPYDPAVWENEAEYEADCRANSLARKLREAVYAMAMEARYTKDEILTIYMNRAYLGAGTHGFQAAAQRYFGRPAAEVGPAEAAMLAGLLVAPTRYAPTTDLERSRERASVILGLMAEQGYLTEAEAATARSNPATLSQAAEERAGGYFADWVMDSAPSFLASETTEDVIVRSTFDRRLQSAAEEALQHVFDTRVRAGSEAQAAIVVMSPDGAVRAMVGGRRTRVAGAFNRATQALRQTGSAFKPFVYATALDMGYSPRDRVDDAPLSLDVPGSGRWSPQNYDREFRGEVTLSDALAQSLNVPAVKVSEAVGRERVRAVAADFGIASDLAEGPALALGTSEATLLEMTAAYAGILNGGSSVDPYGLIELSLLGEEEPLMGQSGGIGERVISRRAAGQLTAMMARVLEEGTGRRARLEGRPAAGKTGTTQAARDAWFIGFTGDYVAGVWMGYDDNTPLSGVTGGGLPAEIWRETMVRIHDGLPVTPLPTRGAGDGPAMARGEGAPEGDRNPLDVAERVLNDVLGSIFGRE